MTTTPASPASPEQPTSATDPVSFEEFLARADEDTRAEWVDGEIEIMSPARADHQRLMRFLLGVIDALVHARQLGEVFSAPFLMRLPTRPSGREPDLLFVTNEHADRVRETYLDGPADLVVEIVSPESDERDRGAKFVEYEAAGIPEYWLLDQLREEAAFYQLGADGRYHSASLDVDGIYHSAMLPGLRLRVAWLWHRPLPSVAEVLAQMDR